MNTKKFARVFGWSLALFGLVSGGLAAVSIGLFRLMDWLYAQGVPMWLTAVLPMVAVGFIFSALMAWRHGRGER